jgi:hypothetical protein
MGCVSGKCAQCVMGAAECVGSSRRVCGLDRQWGPTTGCTYGCDAPSMQCRACTPGTTRCTNNIIEGCSDSGVWSNGTSCGAYGCRGDTCGECIAGSIRCPGPSAQSQDVCEDGAWQGGGCRPNSSCDDTPIAGNTCPCNVGFVDPHPADGLCM